MTLLMTELWQADLWATLKLLLKWRLLLTGERERKAEAPSPRIAAAWLVKEPSRPKWTDASVEGPTKMFAIRLLGCRNKTRGCVYCDAMLSARTLGHWRMLACHFTSDSDSESGWESEGPPVASLWTRSLSWLMKCVVSWGGCHWGLVMAKCIRDNSVFPSSACW